MLEQSYHLFGLYFMTDRSICALKTVVPSDRVEAMCCPLLVDSGHSLHLPEGL